LEHTIDVASEAVVAIGVDFALNTITEIHEGLTTTPMLLDQFGVLTATAGAAAADESVSWKSLDHD
jgi:hypothetical protein